ncbi:excalibur calcium-binding protein [Streptomyces glaucescens]|uniref:excalibur calcium-binding protein n=1 Tax=Streptomyces glaucescens TaxID=1907 RepID=UPI0034510602
MRRRTGAAGALFAIIATVPSAGPAHAQDLDCTHFGYQEDAQAVFDADRSDPHRLDEDEGPDDGIACEVLPVRGGDGDGDRGDLTSSTSRPRPTTAPAAPVSPAPVAPATPVVPVTPVAPVTPAVPVTPVPPTAPGTATAAPPAGTATATGAPTRGVRGGVGGASETGPGTWDLALGATFVAGAALATGYVVRRRRR